MVDTESEDRRWLRRHAWIVVLIAVQAVTLGAFGAMHSSSSWFALGAILTVVAPAVLTAFPWFDRGVVATISSATLLAQTVMMMALLGTDIRPYVLLLADLCVISLYEIPVLFAGSFAAVAVMIVALTVADPRTFGVANGNTRQLLTVLIGGLLGTGVGVLAMGTRWIEHQRLRHAADEEHRVMQAYMAVAGSMLVILNRDGTVRSANRRACFTLDREIESIVGQDWFDLAHRGEAAIESKRWFSTVFDDLPEVYDGSVEYSYVSPVVTPSGEERQVSWWASILEDSEGNATGMVCSGDDITEQLEAKAEVERGKVELDALRRLAQKVASLDDSRQAICDAAIALTGATLVAICEPDRTRERLTYTTCTDESVLDFSLHLGREASLVGTAFLSGQPQFMGDLQAAPGINKKLAQLASEGRAGSALHQPIMGANGVLGVISVAWDRPLDSLGDRRAELVGLIATEAAIALRRRESLAQLERAALVDPLTGVANRRAFDAELPLALRRAAEGNYPLSLVVMDLNEFKAVNDVLGHEAGDDVLIKAAAAWADALRAGDLLSRIGGDEFTVLLPTCDQVEMDHIIARLRSVTPHGPGTSLGGAVWDGAETVASLIRRADASQYEDKARSKAHVRRTPSGLPSHVPERRRPRHTDPRLDTPALPPGDSDGE